MMRKVILERNDVMVMIIMLWFFMCVSLWVMMFFSLLLLRVFIRLVVM